MSATRTVSLSACRCSMLTGNGWEAADDTIRPGVTACHDDPKVQY